MPAPVGVGLTLRPRTRRRFWWVLVATLIIGGLCSPPPWHVLLRFLLVRAAAQHGGDLAIGRMRGGPFDMTSLDDVRWSPRGLSTGSTGAGTDLRVRHAEITPFWRIPFLQKPVPSCVQRVVLAGISGRWDLATVADAPDASVPAAPSAQGRWLDRLFKRCVPTKLFIQADDLTLQRNRYRLRVRGLRLSGERDTTGLLVVREVEIAGPGFENTLLNRHGETLWQGERLSIRGMDFGPGVRLLSATLDGTHLKSQRLDWEGTLTAMGGEIRGQGALNFIHPRLALEIAGSLQRMPVSPLARLLGFTRPAGGLVEQANFSFRGDPENWPAAQMWLSAQATDFRWGNRDWQSLVLRATVLHQRIQVHRLELQQSRNRLSLTGECPLIAPDQATDRWWEAGFACNVDARLDDLHALAQLFGSRLPEMDGRMSVNGKLETTPGRPGISGYLNVEGSRLNIRGAPLDYLRSTLLFGGDELTVADVQATHGEDAFSGRGTVSLAGAASYQGEWRLAMADPGVYAPALTGVIDLGKAGLPTDGLRLPVRVEGVFYGPGLEGKPVFLTFGDLCPAFDDWWNEM